ncbi:MAG TPA: hypothetical protein VEY10_03820 [Flavisolibacter sp.]|nr:hypothetical protein [Flavisolibacter sp.]
MIFWNTDARCGIRIFFTNYFFTMYRIPTKEELIEKIWVDAYTHFNERLVQRYKISITLAEYKAMCRAPIETILKKGAHRKIGILVIKGTRVLVGKEVSRYRLLKTALSKTGAFKEH